MKRPYNRLLLLDFGHPMNEETFELIKISLKNVFVLAAAFSNDLDFDIGIAVINSEYTLIESLLNLKKNCSLVLSNLDNLDKIVNVNAKITVKEYKQLLYDSITKIVQNFETKSKKVTQGDFFACSQWQNILIQITVVTKKTASVLREILTDILNKLYSTNTNTMTSVKYTKIIQLVHENDMISPVFQKNNSVELITCLDNLHSLESIFKDWLLKTGKEQPIGILLSEEMNLVVKCEVEDCILNPRFVLTKPESDLWDEVLFKTVNGISPTLKILRRAPSSGLCPTLFFGIPRHIYATTNSDLNWNDLEVNQKLFKELCRELLRTQQGLVTKLQAMFGDKDIITYYFITSDGDSLLLNSLASDELHLQRRRQAAEDSQADSNGSSVVKSCLRKVQFAEEYLASEFSSGLYDYLADQLKQTMPKTGFLGHIDPDLSKKTTPAIPLKGRHKFKFWSQSFKPETEELPESQSKKRQIVAESENVHPALLPPSVVKKYRKAHPSLYQPPELNQTSCEDLADD